MFFTLSTTYHLLSNTTQFITIKLYTFRHVLYLHLFCVLNKACLSQIAYTLFFVFDFHCHAEGLWDRMRRHHNQKLRCECCESVTQYLFWVNMTKNINKRRFREISFSLRIHKVRGNFALTLNNNYWSHSCESWLKLQLIYLILNGLEGYTSNLWKFFNV